MKRGPRLAIDFGTTRTKIAYYDSGREQARLIELGASQREIIPSIFYVPKRGAGEILVGDDALAQLDIDPGGIVREIKREIDKLGKKRCGPGRLTPTRVELAAEMLRSIRRRCEEGVFHGQLIDACTLTVPVAFTEGQRNKLLEAASHAGFNDVRLIDEPTAAARAWLEQHGERLGDHIIVVDVGGGTTDFSVVEWSNNRFVAHTSILPEGFAQGGNDIDDHACDELLSRQSEEDEDALLRIRDSFLVKLRSTKEQFTRGLKKQILSSGKSTIEVGPDVFHEATVEFLARLSEELTSFVEKCRSAGISSPTVILVGGASRISGLKAKVEEVCPGKVLSWESADFATVLGAVEYPGNEFSFASSKQRKAQASYIEALKAVIADDQVTQPDSDYLQMRRQQLGLSDEVATGLEIEILGFPLADIAIIDLFELRVQAADEVVLMETKRDIADGRFEEALERLQIALHESPNVPEYLVLKTAVYYEQGKYALAISAATAALKIDPDDFRAVLIRGRSAFRLRNYAQSKDDFGRLFKFSKSYKLDAIFYSSAIAAQAGSSSGLADFLQGIVDKVGFAPSSPRGFGARMIQAFLYLGERKGALAVAAVEDVIRSCSAAKAVEWEAAVNDVKLFFGDKFGYFWREFLECETGNVNAHPNGSVASETDSKPKSSLKALAARLYDAHKLMTKSEGDIARGYVVSCSRVELSVRCIEQFGTLEGIKAALSESARLVHLSKVHPSDVDELLVSTLARFPVDVVQLRQDPHIKRISFLVDRIRAKLEVTEDHGAVFNFVKVTNSSPFYVTNIRVLVKIRRSDGTNQTRDLVLPRLESNCSHTWESVFEDPGWFGGNIKKVQFASTCSEA